MKQIENQCLYMKKTIFWNIERSVREELVTKICFLVSAISQSYSNPVPDAGRRVALYTNTIITALLHLRSSLSLI